MDNRLIVFLLLASVLFAVGVAEAQQPKKVPLMGYLGGSAVRTSPNTAALRQGLRDLAYVEGQHIAIEYQWSEGNTARFPGLAAELVRRKVDIIFAAGGGAARAAKKATSTIPIIFVGSTDPVANGLVESLARPGGNVTGFSAGAPGLYGKRLELLKETLPRLTRVGSLWNPINPAGSLKELRTAGQELGVQIQSLEVRSPNDIDGAFEAASRHESAL